MLWARETVFRRTKRRPIKLTAEVGAAGLLSPVLLFILFAVHFSFYKFLKIKLPLKIYHTKKIYPTTFSFIYSFLFLSL